MLSLSILSAALAFGANTAMAESEGQQNETDVPSIINQDPYEVPSIINQDPYENASGNQGGEDDTHP